MNIQEVLNSIQPQSGDGQVKEAEAQKTPNADTSQGALSDALSKLAATPTSVEVPAEQGGDAIDDLLKMASSLAGAEKEAEAAQAYICGAAFADGCIAKFAAYDAEVKKEAADEAVALLHAEQAKVAQAQQTTVPTPPQQEELLIKQAAAAGYQNTAQELLVKQAADAGYQDAVALLQQPGVKTAEEEGYDAALQQTHDAVVGEFLKGAATTEILLDKYRAQQ